MKLRDIATMLNAEIEGPDAIDIRNVSKIEDAREGEITFLANPKYNRYLESTRASAVIVSRTFKHAATAHHVPTLLRVDDAYISFLKTLQKFHPPSDPLPPGIHPTAVIASSAVVRNGVRIGAHVVVGEKCSIGENSILCQGVVLGDGVKIGSQSLIYPNVTVREGCEIGARVIIHSGTTIGSDGFGFAPKPDGTFEKIPQLGIVVIEDDVEVGANCAIDRATMGETRIKKGAKLDNLIQVAHNVVIGENTVIAAQAGISGSTKIGKNNMIGGQVGIAGHLEIADNTKIGAQSGLHKSITEPGTAYFGYPALPRREAMRLHAAISRLPDLVATVRDLQHQVEELKKELVAKHG